MNKKTDSAPVGYKQPPTHLQFQPGQSGNPNGRPKGTRNFKSDLRDELSETISFREGNREVSISKQRALIKRLVAAAIEGNARSVATLMSFCARAFGDDNDEQKSRRPRIARSLKRSHVLQPSATISLKQPTILLRNNVLCIAKRKN